eukprot:4521953-Amphidinium_carterae.1
MLTNDNVLQILVCGTKSIDFAIQTATTDWKWWATLAQHLWQMQVLRHSINQASDPPHHPSRPLTTLCMNILGHGSISYCCHD